MAKTPARKAKVELDSTPSSALSSAKSKSTRSTRTSVKEEQNDDEKAVTPLTSGRRSTRSTKSLKEEDDEDADLTKVEERDADYKTPIKKTHLTKSFDTPGSVESTAPSPGAMKKLQILDQQLGVSPYPDYSRPTPEGCQEVYDLLCAGHGIPERPAILEDRPNAAAGCGQVPDALDALIRTVLSQNTSSRNSTAAKNSMDAQYGRAEHRKVLEGGEDTLEETIRCGGLAKVKAKSIIKILKRLDEKQGGKGRLSLDYLHKMSDRDAMKELCSFDLIGVKTASCVLLFCLGRDSFAVDTHVHRITQSLGWIPASATRDTAFFHLDVRIPNELKYGLHSLLVRHGRGCERCAANGVTSSDHIDYCPLKGISKTKSGKSSGKKSSPKKEDKIEIEIEIEDDKEKVSAKIEKLGDGEEALETEVVRPKRKARGGKKVKDESSGSEVEEKEEKVMTKKRKVKVGTGRGVQDDEREMSGIQVAVGDDAIEIEPKVERSQLHGLDA